MRGPTGSADGSPVDTTVTGTPLSRVERLLASTPVARLDTAGLRAAASLRGNAPLDRAAYALSELANHSVLWHGINAVDALTTGDPLRRRRALRRSVLLAVEQAVVNGPLKSSVRRERPEVRDDHPHRLRTPATSSFPSGHASAGACAATLLSRDLGHAPLWWGAATVVAWTRVHVGVHHTSDVAAGAVVGAALAAFAERIWPPPARSDGDAVTSRRSVARG